MTISIENIVDTLVDYIETNKAYNDDIAATTWGCDDYLRRRKNALVEDLNTQLQAYITEQVVKTLECLKVI